MNSQDIYLAVTILGSLAVITLFAVASLFYVTKNTELDYEILTVKKMPFGGYLVNDDFYVPECIDNSDYLRVSKWLEEEGEITDYNKYSKRLLAGNVPDNLTGNNPVLVCFEKPTDFCHRQVVARWFREHGLECEEL